MKLFHIIHVHVHCTCIVLLLCSLGHKLKIFPTKHSASVDPNYTLSNKCTPVWRWECLEEVWCSNTSGCAAETDKTYLTSCSNTTWHVATEIKDGGLRLNLVLLVFEFSQFLTGFLQLRAKLALWEETVVWLQLYLINRHCIQPIVNHMSFITKLGLCATYTCIHRWMRIFNKTVGGGDHMIYNTKESPQTVSVRKWLLCS